MDNNAWVESLIEAKRAIEEKRALVSQLNVLNEQLWINPYDNRIKSKIEATKEKIDKLNKKIKTLKLRDLHRD